MKFFKLLFFLILITTALNAQAQKEFDVIVLKDNSVIYGLVTEVGIELIKYRKSSMPDGPIFTLFKSEVFMISFRDQSYEMYDFPDREALYMDEDVFEEFYEEKDPSFFSELYSQGSAIRVGVGLITGYSAVDQINSYNSTSTRPGFFVSYSFPWKFLSLSGQAGILSASYSRVTQEDQAQRFSDVDESIFYLAATAKYTFISGSAIQPYVQAGLVFYRSRLENDFLIQYETGVPDVDFSTKSTALNPNFIARAGFDYYVNPRFGAFLDFGIGPNLVQAGVLFKLKKQEEL